MAINIIVAVDKNYGIGKGNDLLFRSKKDMARFKELTTGHIVIMGSKTWESLPPSKRPLPDRRNVVVSRRKDYPNDGAFWVEHDLMRALRLYRESGEQDKDLWVIGGAEIYKQALPYADKIYMTVRKEIVDGADTFFPKEELEKFVVGEVEPFEEDGIKYSYVTHYNRWGYDGTWGEER